MEVHEANRSFSKILKVYILKIKLIERRLQNLKTESPNYSKYSKFFQLNFFELLVNGMAIIGNYYMIINFSYIPLMK
jgi:hypothetical protein